MTRKKKRSEDDDFQHHFGGNEWSPNLGTSILRRSVDEGFFGCRVSRVLKNGTGKGDV